ncbi:Na+/H+ antiporter NhaA [Alteromonas gracilis]
MNSSRSSFPRLFRRASWAENVRIAEVLRLETVGGGLLMLGALIALIWANSPWVDSYVALRDYEIGPAALHLDLSLGTWAADGLLAIFFFIVGLELKREFVAGDLRDPRTAALPIIAAMGGVIVPALVFTVINLNTGGGALNGWAIPTATDIAFALAVLAVIGRHLPSALRTFLLTLAVVDDLIAVTIIAIFYTADLDPVTLLLALVPIALFAVLVQKRVRSGWILIPLAVLAWVLVHESGVHATVAGVLLGFTVPVLRRDGRTDEPGLAEHLEHRFRPISAGFAVPVFAFFAAGVTVGGVSGLVEGLQDPVAIGIVAGLVIGKIVGITLTTWLLSTFTRAQLDDDLTWSDVIGVASLAGIGFTVALLVGDLAFRDGTEWDDLVKVAVLTGSLISAVIASVILGIRNRAYKAIEEKEKIDADNDGIPDAFQERDRS